MKRRALLQLSLMATALSASAKIPLQEKPKKGFKIAAGNDRFDDKLNIMGGEFNCMISSKDTDGGLCVYNTVRHEKGGPALHLHHEQDEWFYVVKGEFIVKVGEETMTLKAGDSAFAPRTIPHSFAKVSEGEAQMLVLFQPAGSMEDFFKEMSKLTGGSVPQDYEKTLKDLWASHGMQIVGPPLKF